MPKKEITALEAKYEAQKIAFAPVVFQAARVLNELGVLDYLLKCKSPCTISKMDKELKIGSYGLSVLLELAFEGGIVDRTEDAQYSLTKTGYFLLRDTMTIINMNFIHDVCYKGLYHLKESILEKRAAGLEELGQWPTIYDGLKDLDKKALDSWLAFDHYYSDVSLPEALEIVFRDRPGHLVDVGGNTGKWAIACCQYDPGVQVTIVDLPGQLEMANKNVKKAGFENRIRFEAIDILKPQKKLPEGDVFWMSQFLDCFSKEQIVDILKHTRKSMNENSRLFVMETFWDIQRFPAAAFSLTATSLYFTTMANGYSKMYGFKEFKELIEKAGMKIEEEFHEVGISHTLLKIKKHV